MPALAPASVSANIPSFPVILSSFVSMVMFPPSPVLLEPIKTVALAWAFSPMSTVLAWMVISPGLPSLAVSVISLVFLSKVRLLACMFIVPAFPMSSVLARILLLLVSSMFWSVSKVIWPAFPWELVVLMKSVLSSVMLPRL